MGILFKDIQQGRYYKGYDAPAPAGKKCFYFIEQAQMSSGGTVVFSAWTCPRKVSVKQWKRPSVPVAGNVSDSSLLKEMVHYAADVGPEGIARCPAQAAPNAAPKQPQPTAPVPTPVLVAPKQPSKQPDLAAQAKAERNKGKVAIPENARSRVCTKCGGANKEVLLFSFSEFWCPVCEPE